MNDDLDSELPQESYISRLLEGELPAGEVDKFKQLLRDHADLRAQLMDHLLLDFLLQEELASDSIAELVDLLSSEHEQSISSNQPLQQVVSSAKSVGLKKANVWKYLKGGILITVLLGVFFQIFRMQEAAFASADRIMQAAMEVHHGPLERVYLVQVEASVNQELPTLAPRDVRIMTTGDQYYVEMKRGEKRLTWGRNAAHEYWIALGDKRGMVIQEEEMGQPLKYITDLYSLNLETLLANFLKYCRLDYEVQSESTHLITITPNRRWKGMPLKQATIEVDRETKVIKKLIIERVLPQQAPSRVTFTLIETREAYVNQYQLAGHLSEPLKIITSETQPDHRGELLKNWFGPSAERWLKKESQEP